MSQIALRLLQFIIGFIGIGIVVLIHEAGHFIAARLLGVRVETFGVGMGPRLFSIHGRETEYRFSLIPFGGYCRMDGSIDLVKALRDDVKSFDKGEYGSYFTTTPLVRLLIFISGPLMNFILSVLLFLIIALIPTWQAVDEARIVVISDYPSLFGSSITQDGIESGDIILSIDRQDVEWWQEAERIISEADMPELPMTVLRDGIQLGVTAHGVLMDGTYRYGIALWQEPVIGRVEGTGLFKTGDRIVSVNGKAVENTYDLYMESGKDMEIEILRNGSMTDVYLPATTSFPFAWQSELVPLENLGFFSSIASGFTKAVETVVDTFSSLVSFIHLDSEQVRNEITGPTRAAQTIGNITTLGFKSDATSGIRAFLYLLSMVSISLCVANLLPIPTFDGGQMVINIWQMITRKELSPRSYVVFQIAGIVCTVIILVGLYSLDFIHYFG